MGRLARTGVLQSWSLSPWEPPASSRQDGTRKYSNPLLKVVVGEWCQSSLLVTLTRTRRRYERHVAEVRIWHSTWLDERKIRTPPWPLLAPYFAKAGWCSWAAH